MNHKSNGKGRKYVISSSTYICISIQWSENNWVILLHNHIYGTQQNNLELIAQYVSGEKCILHSNFMTKKKEDKELQLK